MARLGELGKIITGNTPATSNPQNYSSNDICFVKPSDISSDEIRILNSSEYYVAEFARSNARILPARSVLVTCIGIIGKVAINAVECAFNQQINAIIPNEEKCIPEYLAYAIQHKQPLLQAIANAPVVPIINKSQFSDIEIRISCLHEQQEIINNLDSICNLIALRKQQLAKLDELVKSRFIEMFGACNCRISTLGEEFSFISRGKSPSYVELSNLAVINQACIYWNGLNLDKVKYNDVSYSGDRILQLGDVLVNSTGTGTLGRANVFMFRNADKRYMADSHVTIIRSSTSCHPIYIKCYLEQTKIQDAIYRNCVSGSTNQIELSKEKFKELELPVPPMALQQQFATFVEQTDKSKLAVQQSIDQLETLKKSLMQKYFG